MSKPTVYLVDDNDAFRRSTMWVLEAGGFEVRAFPGGPALLTEWTEASAVPANTCLLSDIRMPGMSGLELQQELRRRHIDVPLVFITGHGDVPLAVEAMRNGALNFIEKPCAPEHLVQVLKQSLEHPVNTGRASDDDGSTERLAQLTPRERQVFDLVVEGKLNKTVADVLSISIKTVEMHRANMMTKLGARNLPDLVRLAIAARDGGSA